MNAAINEFARPFRIDTIGDEARTVTIAADASERGALAARFGLVAIDRLEAEARLHRTGTTIVAKGVLHAQVIQSCVATAAPLHATIDTGFTLRFVPEGDPPAQDEIELSEEDCDNITYASGAIDLGEAVAEELALALDPFPRAPDAEAALRAAGVVPEEEAAVRPFAGLSALKDRLGQ